MRPHDFSLRQLQYVVAVADTLGFHKAAARCNVSQPTLSAQIQQLERVLGVTLFERDRRRVLVTDAGRAVAARARQVLVDVDDLLAVSKGAQDALQGTLRVGVIPTVAPYLLPDITPAVAAAHPRLTLIFREEKTETIVRELGEGALDAGIVALEADLGDCAHAAIFRDAFVAALPKSHPLARKRRLTVDDLATSEVLLLDDGHCFRTQALALCSRGGARETAFRATSLSTLAQMVSVGTGMTLLPELSVAVENRRGQLAIRPFVAPVPGRTIALVWRRRSPIAPALTRLAATLRTAVLARGAA